MGLDNLCIGAFPECFSYPIRNLIRVAYQVGLTCVLALIRVSRYHSSSLNTTLCTCIHIGKIR